MQSESEELPQPNVDSIDSATHLRLISNESEENNYNPMVGSATHLHLMLNKSEEYNYNPMVDSATQFHFLINKSEENYNPMVGFDKIWKSVSMCPSCTIKQDTETHFCGQ